jgi:hypothetical protein
MHVKPLLIGSLALGLAAMLPGDASATAAYGPCLPSSVQVVFNGQQLYIGCRSPLFYFDSGGALRSANNIALNLSSTTATAFNSYVSVATAALLSGKSLYIWPNFGIPATSDLVYFQDLSIQ